MAESFSREKLRHAPQKEGGSMRSSVRPSSCVTPAGTSNELDVQNEWEENIHTQYPRLLSMTLVLKYSSKSMRMFYHCRL